ncbi:glycoside hydrolase family 28 protein [Mycena floridula]|nr:glycoside hydrolase family 28 protein [Mycena floridula]
MRLSVSLLISSLWILSAYATSGEQKLCTLTASGGDDAPQFLKAVKACATVTIPTSTTLTIATRLNTTGLHDKHLDLKGTIRFVPDFPYWTGNAFTFPFQNTSTYWILGGKNLLLDGGGTIDGAGQGWWDQIPLNATIQRPVTMTLYQAKNVVVKNIRMINSPNWFNFVNEGQNVLFDNITINAASTSTEGAKNTDGWDTYRSDNVVISNSIINNGDDCVSFKPNSTNILVSNLKCTGSQSLGQYAGQFDIVENVTAIDIVMTNAGNGARMKAWAGAGVGSGRVSNILFSNFLVNNVDSPITIDQCYSTNATACAANPSNTYFDNIWFTNITGTASGATVAALKCSPDGRCGRVNVNDLHLLPGAGFNATYICQNIALTGNSASLFPAECQGVV